MAISVDSSTVALATAATGVVTTATFSVAADTMVVAMVGHNASNTDAAGDKIAVTNNKSLTVTEKVERGHRETTGFNGGSGIAWMYSAGAQTGMTVTATLTGVSAVADEVALKVLLLSGAGSTAADVPDSAEGSTTTNAPSLAVTSTITDGIACYAGDDWTQSGAPTWTGTGVTGVGTYDITGQVSGGFAWKTVSATGSQAATYDAPGTAAIELQWCAATFKAAGGGAAASLLPHPARRLLPILVR